MNVCIHINLSIHHMYTDALVLSHSLTRVSASACICAQAVIDWFFFCCIFICRVIYIQYFHVIINWLAKLHNERSVQATPDHIQHARNVSTSIFFIIHNSVCCYRNFLILQNHEVRVVKNSSYQVLLPNADIC